MGEEVGGGLGEGGLAAVGLEVSRGGLGGEQAADWGLGEGGLARRACGGGPGGAPEAGADGPARRSRMRSGRSPLTHALSR
jgi:hypothetical protein